MTVFSVQRFLEDHFERRGLADIDQYAIKVANLVERLGPRATDKVLARQLAHVRTAFFRRNRDLDRKDFETRLVVTLRRQGQKKKGEASGSVEQFARTLAPVRARFRARRRSIQALLSEFRRAVESRAVDAFWNSRKDHILRSRTEKIAQALLAVFAKGVVGSRGLVLREIASGIGFVDVGVSFAGILHLVELKILKGRLTGANQIAMYMRTEGRRKGWLVLIDARRNLNREPIPDRIDTPSGAIATVVVNVNPTAPHRV